MGSTSPFAYVIHELGLREFAEETGPYRASTLTELEAAYLGGIIDGEGTIGIYGISRNPGYYYLRLIIPRLRSWLTEMERPKTCSLTQRFES